MLRACPWWLILTAACSGDETLEGEDRAGDSGVATDTATDPATDPATTPPDTTAADTGCAETLWYADRDGDGAGQADVVVSACTAPEGFVASATDCDDGDAAVRPGATEVCFDRIDNDCDGLAAPTCRVRGTWGLDRMVGGLLPTGADRLAGPAAVLDLTGDGALDVVAAVVGGEVVGLAGPLEVLGETALPELRFAVPASGVFGLPDISGDGRDDLAMASVRDDGTGRLFAALDVFFGPRTAASSPASADVTFDALQPRATTGELTGDGVLDLLVVLQDFGERGGGAYLFLGPVAAAPDVRELSTAPVQLISKPTKFLFFGDALALADFDDDGVTDLAYGDRNKERAHVVRGPLAGTIDLSASGQIITGPASDEGSFGASITAVPGAGAQGRPALLVSDLVAGPGGYRLFADPLAASSADDASAIFEGTEERLVRAQRPSAAADLSGDGVTDLVLRYFDPEPGAAGLAVFYGPFAGTQPLADADLVIAGDLGVEVGLATGDLTGDGVADLVVTDADATFAASSTGGVGVYTLSGL